MRSGAHRASCEIQKRSLPRGCTLSTPLLPVNCPSVHSPQKWGRLHFGLSGGTHYPHPVHGRSEGIRRRDLRELEATVAMVQSVAAAVGMGLGASKCGVAHIKGGRVVQRGGVAAGDAMITELTEGDHYKYLGVEQLRGPVPKVVKGRVKSEYYRRVRKVWKLPLSSKHRVKAHNSVCGGFFRYYAPLLRWTQRELIALDRTTRQILRTQHCHHRSASVARLYLPRPKGGRGLLNLQQEWERSVVSAVAHRRQSLDQQIKGVVALEESRTMEGHRTQLRQAASLLERHRIPTDELCTVTPKKLVTKLKQSQMAHLEETLLSRRIHGIELQKPDTNTKASVRWLTDGMLSAETEATLTEMQDGTTHTRKYLHEVAGKSTLSKQCRACGEGTESLGHILSRCTSHYFSLYKHRHDRILYVLVRQVLTALKLSLPNHMTGPGGIPRTGVYGHEKMWQALRK